MTDALLGTFQIEHRKGGKVPDYIPDALAGNFELAFPSFNIRCVHFWLEKGQYRRMIVWPTDNLFGEMARYLLELGLANFAREIRVVDVDREGRGKVIRKLDEIVA